MVRVLLVLKAGIGFRNIEARERTCNRSLQIYTIIDINLAMKPVYDSYTDRRYSLQNKSLVLNNIMRT